MKRLLCVLLVFMLCMTMVLPAYASDFVPSIGDKEEPPYIPDLPIDPNCDFKVTPVSKALNTAEPRPFYMQELVDVYYQLKDGSMTLPYPADKAENMVIRDLFDISYLCDHEHDLTADPLDITFDLGVKATDEVLVYVYVNGQWTPADRVVNYGDGSVGCGFTKICPVVFCVEVKPEVPTQPTDPSDPSAPTTPGGQQPGKPGGSPETGDTAQILLWTVLLLASFVAVILLLLTKRRKNKKKK